MAASHLRKTGAFELPDEERRFARQARDKLI
eukprot:COSAG06_NODE_9159_length_1970_cov_157.092998_2_plen_30_part_01